MLVGKLGVCVCGWRPRTLAEDAILLLAWHVTRRLAQWSVPAVGRPSGAEHGDVVRKGHAADSVLFTSRPRGPLVLGISRALSVFVGDAPPPVPPRKESLVLGGDVLGRALAPAHDVGSGALPSRLFRSTCGGRAGTRGPRSSRTQA